jgi:hypothetical protein
VRLRTDLIERDVRAATGVDPTDARRRDEHRRCEARDGEPQAHQMTGEPGVDFEQGVVESVAEVPLGSELIADIAIGVTQLVVVDAADFNEGGGQLQIVSDAATELVAYSTFDDDADTITLSTADDSSSRRD